MLFHFDRALTGVASTGQDAAADPNATMPAETAPADLPARSRTSAGSALAHLKSLEPRLTPAQRTSIQMLERHAAFRMPPADQQSPGAGGNMLASRSEAPAPRPKPALALVAPTLPRTRRD